MLISGSGCEGHTNTCGETTKNQKPKPRDGDGDDGDDSDYGVDGDVDVDDDYGIKTIPLL
jgi:hypothetical protein